MRLPDKYDDRASPLPVPVLVGDTSVLVCPESRR